MNQRVVIVGGGIIGCLSAMALVERGCQVTLVERHQVGRQGVIDEESSGASSWAGAGILVALLPWLYQDAVNRLVQVGAALYPGLCERLHSDTGIDPEYQLSGMLILPQFDPAAAQQWCQQYGVSAQMESPAAWQVQFPNSPLAADSFSDTDALWLPDIGQIRPPSLLKALRAWLLKHGVTLLENTELAPLTLDARQQNLESWSTTQGTLLQADQFVLASGAWASRLLGSAWKPLSLKPMRGQMLLYQQPPKPLAHLVYREGFYLVPRKDGLIVAGSTLEDVGFDARITGHAQQELRHKAEALLPQLADMPVIKHWSGLRPGSPDNLPVISVHPAVSNLYLNIGHFRYGLTMAPSSAQLLADLVLKRVASLDETPYQRRQ